MYANTYGIPLSSWAQYEPRPMTTHLQPVKTPYEIVKLQLYTAFEIRHTNNRACALRFSQSVML